LAQAFAALGTQVTLIHEADRVLDTHEPAAGRLVGAALERMGVEVLLGEPVNRVRQDGDEVVVELPSGARHRAGLLAIAVGRSPRLHGIGLETAGIDSDAPEIDGSFRTPSGVFIAGDASAEGMYTHMANAQADVVVAALVGDGRRSIDDAIAGARSPSVVFTAPQVSTVGIRSSDAPEGSVSVEVDLARTAAAATMGRDVVGAMVGVFAADGTIIGTTFVGPTAGEMLHAATIAVANRLTVDRLALAIPPFPTLSGIWDVLIAQVREKLAAG
jgi:dihydrolipoamide dehydrogenase